IVNVNVAVRLTGLTTPGVASVAVMVTALVIGGGAKLPPPPPPLPPLPPPQAMLASTKTPTRARRRRRNIPNSNPAAARKLALQAHGVGVGPGLGRLPCTAEVWISRKLSLSLMNCASVPLQLAPAGKPLHAIVTARFRPAVSLKFKASVVVCPPATDTVGAAVLKLKSPSVNFASTVAVSVAPPSLVVPTTGTSTTEPAVPVRAPVFTVKFCMVQAKLSPLAHARAMDPA